MGMAEIRDAFEAYASGELAEYELRSALRAEVQTQPGSVKRYAAMAAALRRRNLISAQLEATVVSDMNAIVANAATVANPDETVQEPAQVNVQSVADAQPTLPPPVVSQPRPAIVGVGSTRTRLTAQVGSWDNKEQLAEPATPVTLGMVLRDRFELTEELGRGGMGVVYKAVDRREVENKGREPHVAIKVLNEEFKRQPQSARALQRESKKAMRLAHPNIVLVRDFDRDRGNVYMVMELLHGTPLDQVVLRKHPEGMPPEKVVEIVRGIGSALSYAHEQGIVHADLKPSNVFLTTSNAVKVLDFGVARVALALDRGYSTMFDAGKLNAVSPAYASIELLVGEAPDARDDIYALACVTYFLLVGRHPFNGIDAMRARDSGLQPAPICSIADQQYAALKKGLLFNRWERTASVKEFISEFCIECRRPLKIGALTSHPASITAGTARAVFAGSAIPWLTIASGVGIAVLIAGLAFLVAPHLRSNAVTALPPPTVPSATPSADNSGTLEQPGNFLSSIDPSSPNFVEQMLAQRAEISHRVAMAPEDPRLRALQSQLQIAASKRVESLLMRNDLAQAQKLVSQVIVLLPPGARKAYAADAMEKRQELAHLLAMPAANQHWADELAQAITSLAALAPADDVMIKDARELSDNTFERAAQDARSRQRLDEAREYLAMGISVNQQSTRLTRAALELARQEPEAVQRADDTSTRAEAPSAAPSSSTAPIAKVATGRPGPIGDPIFASSGNRALDSVVIRARQQMSDGNLQQALDTLAAGRKKFARSQRLKDLEITYDRVAEEADRLNPTPYINLKDHEAWIREIRSLAGDDYPGIEYMLVRTLANNIAEQRSRGDRASVVVSLLESGRRLFPDYADALEHGSVVTAGSSDEAASASR